MVSPFGGTTADFFQRMLRGESAIAWHQTEDKPKPLALPAVRCAAFDAEAQLGKSLAGSMDRFAQLGVAAALEAWSHAALTADNAFDPESAGVSWGTALGGVQAFERGYRDLWQRGQTRLSPLSVVMGMNNAPAAHIGIRLGLGNANLSYTVACASASAAIGEAFERIRQGRARIMLTGGSDATLSYAVVRAWEALRVLAPGDAHTAAQACRPFHARRGGLVLAEGAAALVLEDWAHAVARGAPILAELVGYGATCDHHHVVRPVQAGQERAIRQALDQAGIDPVDVDYVNAHGTATREGDPTEINALKAVFGHHAPSVAVSATKSMHGHAMGATGAIEALITVMALQQDAIPPTANLDAVDPLCAGVNHVTGGALRHTGLRVALSNSFAFGGSNAVLAFRKVDPF